MHKRLAHHGQFQCVQLMLIEGKANLLDTSMLPVDLICFAVTFCSANAVQRLLDNMATFLSGIAMCKTATNGLSIPSL